MHHNKTKGAKLYLRKRQGPSLTHYLPSAGAAKSELGLSFKRSKKEKMTDDINTSNDKRWNCSTMSTGNS